jgi:hypothetical protein
MKDPFASASPDPSGSGNTSDASTLVRPAPAPRTDSGASIPGTVVPPEVPDIDEDALLGRRKRGSGLHPAALALIAAGAVFGGVAAYMLLRTPEPQGPQIVSVTASASAGAGPAAPSGSAETVVAADPAGGSNDPTAPVKAGGTQRLGGPLPKSSGTPAASIDMSGFQVPNVTGPTATAPGTSGTTGGSGLTAGEMSAVVEQNRPLVKRRCWQPALDANKGLGGGSARVSASITIAPSGAVQSVTAGGAEKDYPGLSSCIASRIQGWKFPAAGAPTNVNVPFVFAAQ